MLYNYFIIKIFIFSNIKIFFIVNKNANKSIVNKAIIKRFIIICLFKSL